MSNQPAHLEAQRAGGLPCGRQGIWQVLREAQTFTLSDLCRRMPHLKRARIKEYLQSLYLGGFLQRGGMVKDSGNIDGKSRQYTLIKDVGVEAPRLRSDGTVLPPTGQQNMWLALKVLRDVTPDSLASHASTDESPVPVSAAESYLRHLSRAGYLAARLRGAAVTYRLVRDTGGFAPLVQRTKVVFDPNLQRVVWNDEVEE